MGGAKGQQVMAFQQRKATFLGKDDKSSAGGIDAHAQEVCAAINQRADAFTTSSCSGRAFLWRGEGVKSTNKFSRYRVTHELIPEAEPYFDLRSLEHETVDGAWEDEKHRMREKQQKEQPHSSGSLFSCLGYAACRVCSKSERSFQSDRVTWLRFEPFILHVDCRDLTSAANIISAARTVFKNVGVQSWKEGKVMVAIWGDEGLEMALSDPHGRSLFSGHSAWLQDLVNSRHQRNWAKIDRFTAALRAMPSEVSSTALLADSMLFGGEDAMELEESRHSLSPSGSSAPKHFDIVGDVVVLGSAPSEENRSAVGAKILAENRKARIVAARCGSLQTDHRKPVTLDILAGPERRPLITTHSEFGVRYVVNLEAVFFSARMGPERQRLCAQIQDGERVFVAFAGCGPEVLQILDKTKAESVVAVELNPDALQCARRSLDLLLKRDSSLANRVEFIEGDVCSVASQVPQQSFHRVLAPRPKGKTDAEDDELVAAFLQHLLPLLRSGGVCHWYDFVADWEFPECARSVARIGDACAAFGRQCNILRCAAANNKPVAERQYRTVIDFSVV